MITRCCLLLDASFHWRRPHKTPFPHSGVHLVLTSKTLLAQQAHPRACRHLDQRSLRVISPFWRRSSGSTPISVSQTARMYWPLRIAQQRSWTRGSRTESPAALPSPPRVHTHTPEPKGIDITSWRDSARKSSILGALHHLLREIRYAQCRDDLTGATLDDLPAPRKCPSCALAIAGDAFFLTERSLRKGHKTKERQSLFHHAGLYLFHLHSDPLIFRPLSIATASGMRGHYTPISRSVSHVCYLLPPWSNVSVRRLLGSQSMNGVCSGGCESERM
jgi:hypothetical protein